jgi:chemotaxis protein CheD
MSTFERTGRKGMANPALTSFSLAEERLPQSLQERSATYLHPGQSFVGAEPARISTIVGSCVAVCLWDARKHKIGVTHFLLPQHDGRGPASSRYGDVALKDLLERLLQLGCHRKDLLAKVYGGACVFEAFRSQAGEHLGIKNSSFALQWLQGQGIRVTETNVGGTRGRKIEFDADGTACVREV